MTQISDEYVKYRFLVERVNDMDGDKKYIIGEYSGDGGFEEDAKKIRRENPAFDLIHAKLYLCALMQDPPVNDKDVYRAIERVDEVHDNNIGRLAQEVSMRLA